MEAPIVEISDGKLRGIITKNHKGEPVYAFLGVPFGKPPIGELRFKAPLPVEPWSGIKDAVQDGNPCYHNSVWANSNVGSEDCLFLNVFTKSISNNQTLKPVLIFIHGGAFVGGSNATDIQSPIFLMMEDIVFVSINYRLGALGFLSLSDTSLEVPGNAGLKDQLLALKWVQKNIEKFGGDPNNVTLSGMSAGSASVNYHVLSPASKGLFHKAIMTSGTVLNPWPHLNPKYLDILKYLKIDLKDEAEILNRLRKIPVKELVEAQNKLENDLVDSTFRSFAPCVEKPNPTAFLTRKPIDIITAGDYNKVPMLISFTSNEGLYLNMYPDEAKKINTDPYIPPQIVLPDDEVKREQLLKELRTVYNFEICNDNKYLATSDSMFTAGIIAFTKHVANSCPQPVYLYEFDVVGSRNFLRQVFKINNNLPGACHGDDTGYLFEIIALSECPIIPGSVEEITMQRVVQFWTNFAKYGNPNPNEKQLNLSWQPVTKDTLHYLHFGKELSMKTNPEEERMRMWGKIYQSTEDTKYFMP